MYIDEGQLDMNVERQTTELMAITADYIQCMSDETTGMRHTHILVIEKETYTHSSDGEGPEWVEIMIVRGCGLGPNINE